MSILQNISTITPIYYNIIFPYHVYFRERVKGHWTSTIVSNRDHILTIAIDFIRYWVANLFNHLAMIVRRIEDVVCYVLS